MHGALCRLCVSSDLIEGPVSLVHSESLNCCLSFPRSLSRADKQVTVFGISVYRLTMQPTSSGIERMAPHSAFEN